MSASSKEHIKETVKNQQRRRVLDEGNRKRRTDARAIEQVDDR